MVPLLLRFSNGLEISAVVREGTPSVESLVNVLPFKSSVHRWGDEIYFDAPFHAERERDARAEMEVGEVAFWPDGDAIAIFFGPTPVSTDDKPRAYSPCNILGRLAERADRLRTVDEGMTVELRRS